MEVNIHHRRACGILLILPLAALSACSTATKIPEYVDSRLQPSLEVPPDLDRPVFNERTRIPDFPPGAKAATGNGLHEALIPGTRSIEEPPVLLEEE